MEDVEHAELIQLSSRAAASSADGRRTDGGDVVDEDVTVGLGSNGVTTGDGDLPAARQAPNPHRQGDRRGLRQIRMPSGWGEFIAGLYGSGVSLRHLIRALEQHWPWWYIVLYGALVIAGLAYASYGVLKWFTPRHLQEKRPGRHGPD
jgi:hypothetical protein